MKQPTLLLCLGVLTAFLVSSDAGRYQRSLDRSGINKRNEEVTLLKQDVLDHITSTFNPTKSVTKHSTKTEATNHVIEPTYKPFITTRESEPTGEQLQKIPEDIPPDSHIEVSYERKIMLQEENPQTETSNFKNESTKKDYSNFITYKYNQSSPLSSINSEVTVSHLSYEQSSSVMYSIDDEEDDDFTPEYEPSTKSTHLKSISERKKKKKELFETVTVPTQWSTAKPFTELPNKVDKIKTDALDERQSTTNSNNSLNIYNKLEPDNNSLDFSVTTVSSDKDNTISQSGKIVINNRVNIDEPSESSTKKPRMTFSVKKSAVINDTSTIPTVSDLLNPDTTRNTVPVLKWEKARSTLKPNSDTEKDIDYKKKFNNSETVQTTEKSQIDSPKSLVIKPSVDFKNKLGLVPTTRTKNGTANSTNFSFLKENLTLFENGTISKSTIKPITSFKDRKRLSKLTQQNDALLNFTIPPTSTAWVPLATLKSVSSNKLLRKPTVTTEKTFVEKKTTETSGKVKEFVSWSTRLQKSTTTQLSAFNMTDDDVTVSPKESTILDSETSSSWSNLKVTSSEITSTETSDSISSVVWTTTELERNSTEADSEDNSPITEEMMSDEPFITVSDSPRSRPMSFKEIEPIPTIQNNPMTTEIVNISDIHFRATTISTNVLHNTSENDTLLSDMNQTSNELKINKTLFEPKISNKIKLKNLNNETIHDIPKQDNIDVGLDDKIPLEDFDDELKKETTQFDLPIEATTSALNLESEEESRENDNESERYDEEIILEKPKHVQTESPVNENPLFDSVEDVDRKPDSNKTISNIDVILPNITDVTEVVTGKPHEGDWYNVSVDDGNKTTTTGVKNVEEELLTGVPDLVSTVIPEVEPVSNTTIQHVSSDLPVTQTSTEFVITETPASVTTSTPSFCSWEENPPPIDSVDGYVSLILQTSWSELCQRKEELRNSIINTYKRKLETCQVLFLNVDLKQCSNIASTDANVTVFLYFVDINGDYDESLVTEFDQGQLQSPFKIIDVKTAEHRLASVRKDDNVVIIAISLTCLVAVGVLVTGIAFLVIRKRRKKFNYGQRCTPVSLDDYSLDNISVYNSVRRKGAFRASKRSYGNPAFDDPNAPTHPVNFAGLANLCNNREALNEEFIQIPIITLKPDELPAGAEAKNRYANVIPLPETRVQLSVKEGGDALDEYINANYVKGPKSVDRFYIACQAPLQSTVTDFWRLIWQEQCKVILMLTALQENGVEKCADYLPPSQVIDCHCLFGDFQVTLKKHEVRDKYLISSLQIKNLETNSWREVTHLWYSSWPATGVPDECSSMIAYLLEAHSYMRNSTGPIVVHCSPGTGRTGTVIAIDLCIREFESCRSVDIPKTVYTLRRDRAGAVQTKDQYAFIYQALNLYATKLTGGALDSI